MQLSKAQSLAVETTDGQVILVSCPGSGKTSTVVRRVAHMVEKGIPAEQILVLTFSKAAADEMKERYEQLASPDSGKPWFSTIHSFCYRAIAPVYGYTPESILKESDAWMIVRQGVAALKKEGRLGMDIRDFAEFTTSCLNEISMVNNNGADWDTYEAKSCPTDDFRAVYDMYEAQKRGMGKIDYDDMLKICLDMFKNDSAILGMFQKQFRYLTVDEYQDTNFMQRDILYLLAGDPAFANLCVVGDDDQSIYKFRGARPEIMLNFEQTFPFCKTIYMDINYRSEPEIIQKAANLIGCNTVRFAKDIKPSKDGHGEVVTGSQPDAMKEVSAVVKKIQDMSKDRKYEDMAVLYRKNSQASMLSMMLMAKGIPFHSNTVVESPYKHWIFTDLVSFYRLANGLGSKHDFLQVINKPNRFIPFSVFNGKLDEDSIFWAIQSLRTEDWKKDKMSDELAFFFSALELLKGKDPAELIRYVLGAARYGAYLKEYARYRKMDEDELMDIVRTYEDDIKRLGIDTMEKWQDYAKSCNEKFDRINKNRSKEGVTLSTMHRAKGLEWDVVFIIGASDKIVPSPLCKDQADIEEERRLFYVAITRAKEYLDISWVEREDDPDMRSRFLHEMEGSQGIGALPDSAFKRFKQGTKVSHPKYGNGFVMKSTNAYVSVKFDTQLVPVRLDGKKTCELSEIKLAL